MVIINAILGMILKSMATFCPIYDLIISIKHFTKYNDIMDWIFDAFFKLRFCSLDYFLVSIERLSNVFYTLSLASLLPFFYKFDNNFKIAFDLAIRGKVQNKQKQNLK